MASVSSPSMQGLEEEVEQLGLGPLDQGGGGAWPWAERLAGQGLEEEVEQLGLGQLL